MTKTRKHLKSLVASIALASTIAPVTQALAHGSHDSANRARARRQAFRNVLGGSMGSGDWFDLARWIWFLNHFDWLRPGGPSPFPGGMNKAQIPSTFAIEGDCRLRSPCHAEQDGDDFRIVCSPSRRGDNGIYEGTVIDHNRIRFSSSDGSRACKARYRGHRGWTGTCENQPTKDNPTPEPGPCAFNFDQSPEAVVYAEKLPKHIPSITACGMNYQDCIAVQDDTSIRIKCGMGEDATYLSASMRGNLLRRLSITKDDVSYSCEGNWDGQAIQGSCKERNRDKAPEDLLTCDDFAVEAYSEYAHGSCPTVLPEQGFTLDGCGIDDTCQAVQRGCLWQIACGEEVFSGTLGHNQKFKFRRDGKKCSLRVGEDGKLRGHCRDEDGGDRCLIRTADPQVSGDCFQMPSAVSTQGCGAFWDDCRVYQDGCTIQTVCENGRRNFNGDVRESSIEFEGLAGYTCNADLVDEDGKKRLLGACTRENDDGTVSECRDLTERFGARLALDWEQ